MDFIDLIERLGSFGLLAVLVFFGLRWGGKRVDRMLDQNDRILEQNGELIKSFQDSVKAFQAFKSEERGTHAAIMERLTSIEEKLENRCD